MKDLSKLSDEDLKQLLAGNFGGMSMEGLRALKDAPDMEEAAPKEEKANKGIIATVKEGVSKFIDKAAEERDALKARGWENLSTRERMDLMAASAIPAAAKVHLGVEAGVKAAPGMVVRAVPTVVGQKLGEFTRVPGAPNVLGAAFAVVGEVAADLMEGQPVTGGKLASAAVGGAVRGTSLAKAGGGAMAREAVKMGATNVAQEEARSLVDTGELSAPSAVDFAVGAGSAGVSAALDKGRYAREMRIKQADEAVANDLMRRMRNAEVDAKITPRVAKPNDFERSMNALVRRDIGLPEDAALNEYTLKNHIDALHAPYRQVATISPYAEEQMKHMVEARASARHLHMAYNVSQKNGRPNMDLLNNAKEMDAIADVFEQDMINEARKNGKDALAEKLIATRPQLAKTYLAERAINFSRGVVDAKVYGDELVNNPGRLNGDARLIADAWNANQAYQAKVGNLLSRTVTIARAAARGTEHSSFGQWFSSNEPSYHPYADWKAETGRLAVLQADKPAEKKQQDMVPASIRRFLP